MDPHHPPLKEKKRKKRKKVVRKKRNLTEVRCASSGGRNVPEDTVIVALILLRVHEFDAFSVLLAHFLADGLCGAKKKVKKKEGQEGGKGSDAYRPGSLEAIHCRNVEPSDDLAHRIEVVHLATELDR